MNSNIRSKIDFSNEKIGYKIREAEIQKIPYMFIVGEKEKDSHTVSVRRHLKGDLGSFKLDEIISKLQKEISTRSHAPAWE